MLESIEGVLLWNYPYGVVICFIFSIIFLVMGFIKAMVSVEDSRDGDSFGFYLGIATMIIAASAATFTTVYGALEYLSR